ncbi:MAG: response regulator transcription factor [Spirochaetaceae bacterium]|nr:response regulator transcription factor [Spirochaetaceae bacterium]
MMKIALVDDEKNVRLAIKTALKQEGFDTVEFSNGQVVLDSLEKDMLPDLFILDIMMPVMDGITLLRQLREKGITTPVMFLTSKDEEFDKVLGLELGADDYLCKPFSIRELVARIHVIFRRSVPSQSANLNATKKTGPITLNELSYTATLNGQPLILTVTEFRILQAFILHLGEVLSREYLIQASYPEETYLNDRAIDCHIKRLRKKLSLCSETQDCIETVYGLGYRFVLQ